MGSTDEPCGRKADFVLVGSPQDGGEGFVATCRECYRKHYRVRPESAEGAVDARAFRYELPVGELMCGDDDASPGLWRRIEEAADGAKDEPVTKRELWYGRMVSDLRARAYHIAVARRIAKIEGAIAILGNLTAILFGVAVANYAVKQLGTRDLIFPVVFIPVYLGLRRLIILGRFRKHIAFPEEPSAPKTGSK